MIHKPDDWLEHYKAEKILDPDALIVLKQYEKRLVDQVDHIVELAHGNRDYVKSASDWQVVEELFNFFASEWPNEYQEFRNAMGDIKQKEGYSKDREIKHVGSLPPRFEKMLKAIFPAQSWDKKFTQKFVNKYPLFKVANT